MSVVLLGAAIVLLVVQSLLAAGHVQAAGEAVAEAADQAARLAARLGDIETAVAAAEALAPGAEVTIAVGADAVEVEVSLSVSLLGPDGAGVVRSVSATSRAHVSEYRSGRDP